MFVKEVGEPVSRPSVLNAKDIPAANTAAVVTIAAATAKQHTVHGVQWSYSTSPTGGRLTVAVNAVTKLDLDITASGPGGYHFVIPGGTNQAVVVTLASGTGACVGKLNVQYTTERSDMF